MTDQADAAGGRSRSLIWAAGALGLAALVLGAARLWFAAHEPLWFDEAFTLSIVSRPDGPSFWRQVYLDSNGPAFYLIERFWSGIAGRSDLALRIPTLLAVWVAGALPLLVPLKGLSRMARATWAVMIFAWWGVGFFLDARCYGLLLMAATGQCLAYGRVMAAPTLRRALMWMTLGALGVLLHYYMLFLVLTQGLIYLGRHRMAAVRTWPAVLVFAPVATWILRHAPRLADYSRLAAIWHPPVGARSALDLSAFVIGPGQPLMLAIVAMILIGGVLIGRLRPGTAADEDRTPEPALILTVAAGVAAFALMLIFGVFGSGLSPRYMIPLAPSLLLGVVLIARAGPRARLTYLALIVVYLGAQARPALDALSAPKRLPRYEFETGSALLAAHGVRNVVFVWDHELAPIMDAATLSQVGGTFFDRARRPVSVRPLVVPPDQDANRLILDAAQGDRPGLIWMFNRAGHTSARRFPPAIAKLDPRWVCDEQGDGTAGALACYRRP